MRRIVMAAAVALGAMAAGAAPAEGSCAETATKLSPLSGKTAVYCALTPEYYSDQGVYGSNYVHYFKFTLSRSKTYSVWLDAAAVATMEIESVEPRELTEAEEESGDVFEPSAMFSEYSGAWGTCWVLLDEDWYIDEDDPEMSDPASWTYIVKVVGNKGDGSRIWCQQGNALPKGIEENPEDLGSITNEGSEKWTGLRTFVTNTYQYCFEASLKGGRRYLFATSGADASNEIGLSFGSGKVTPYVQWLEAPYEASVSYDPDQDETTPIWVSARNPELKAATFRMRYRLVPKRAIASHPSVTLNVGETTDPFVPGRINATDNAYYDDIIDSALFAFTVVKGERYVLSTAGANTNLLMRLYDKQGTKLMESSQDGTRSGNVRIGFTASASGTCYVGVCQKLEDDDLDELSSGPVTLSVEEVTPGAIAADAWDPTDDTVAGATPLTPHPVEFAGESPVTADVQGHGPHVLNAHDWYDLYSFVGRKGLTYTFRAKPVGSDVPPVSLKAQLITVSGATETALYAFGDINLAGETPLTFECTKNAIVYLRLMVQDGLGFDYPAYRVHVAVCDTESGYGSDLGVLTVFTKGCDTATWTLNNESSPKYENGMSVVLPAGKATVKFSSASGFTTPSNKELTLAGSVAETIEGVYNDKYDPKDDYPAGTGTVDGKRVTYAATSWSVNTKETEQMRTLWKTDVADCFSIAGKDGAYYDFALTQDGDEDAVFSITNAERGVICTGKTSVEKLTLPATKAKYILIVGHKDAKNPGETSYVLSGSYANVGSIKFAKTAVTVKDTATSVSLTVNRTAKEGQVRVHYETVGVEAIPGEHYVEQAGSLVWENGDNKAKTITVKLIPKLIAGAYNNGNKTFAVTLRDDGGEYPADIATEKAVVTIQETSKESETVGSVYAKKAPKLATVKTEVGALRGGTFYGVVQAAKGALTNGLPELASVTLTVTAKGGVDDTSKDTLSAKVLLGGKTYTFKTTSNEEPWDEETESLLKKTLTLVTKVANVSYTNTLSLSVFDGSTTDATAWLKALATAKLTMNVPDASNKGVQKDIVYDGDLYRQNAKIQAYLNIVTNFTGYYTVALANPNQDAALAPAGHGYLTLTVDNKGTVKVAGLLADNTKLSFSVTASAVRDDGKGGYDLLVPLFVAKSPYCFGGEIRLHAEKIVAVKPDRRTYNPDGKDFDVLVTAPAGALLWNNDNAALTYEGAGGWSLAVVPVGGWYDTVFNLQNYYRDYAFSISTADITEFPKEALTDGYAYVTGDAAAQQPNDYPVDLQGDALAVDKKSLVRVGGLTDLVLSTNPYNVQLKLARATGIVTGSFSLWSYNETQNKQKEITGIKHNGIVLLQRDACGILGNEILTAGFFNQTVKVTDDDGKMRSWTMSKPFDIIERNVDE